MTCHDIQLHIMNCEECRKMMRKVFASHAGSVNSDAKREASRLNGLKGGRPKKVKNDK